MILGLEDAKVEGKQTNWEPGSLLVHVQYCDAEAHHLCPDQS
jgi:hypothetical protein